MKRVLPVFNIGHFQPGRDGDFYAEDIRTHVINHHFTTRPHKHDFFVVVLFTKGSGSHEIDFTRYPIGPGSLFLLSPGQTHHWRLSDDIEGIIFFHTREFFDQPFSAQRIKDFAFFNSSYNPPLLKLKGEDLHHSAGLFKEILAEQERQLIMKPQRLLALVNLLYIHTARLYKPVKPAKSRRYSLKLREFEDLLDRNFETLKFPGDYAAKMQISERHLNRITKNALNKTPSALILDRSLLEAKRLMMQGNLPISEVAARVGYADSSYFSRLFKKQTGKTPSGFMKSYRH